MRKIRICAFTLLAEGRQPVTFGGWSRVRRPRASLVSSHSGGLGAPPGGTTAPRQELADGRGANASTKSAARGLKNAAVERREARRPTLLAGDPWRSRDRPDRKAGHGCGEKFRTSACRRSAPLAGGKK